MNQKIRFFVIWIIALIAVYAFFVIMLPKIFFWRGMSLYRAGKYQNAAEFIKKALVLKPSNTDYRYYFVKSLSELKPVYKIQKTIYNISNDSKDDGAKILATAKINEWRRNIHENIGRNYIEQAPFDTNIIRWNKNSFPLKVYIDNAGLESLPDYYKSAVSRALSQWDRSVDFVSFAATGQKSDAKILILFEKLPDNVCNGNLCKYVVGYTTPLITRNRLKNMTITIYDKNPAGEYFSDKEVYNTILHEMGHALGIMGHSYSTDDLMYRQAKENSIYTPFREDFHYLSGSDVNTLELLYMLEPTITDSPKKDSLIYTPVVLGSKKDLAKRKIAEAQDYIESNPEISAGYINLAGSYADIKQYKKALKALQSALNTANTDDERFVIYYNFAYIYMNMKKYNTALEYAGLAGKIQMTPDLEELISIIKHNENLDKYSL